MDHGCRFPEISAASYYALNGALAHSPSTSSWARVCVPRASAPARLRARPLPRELENASCRSPRIRILRVGVLVALGHARPVLVDGAAQIEPRFARCLGLRL